MTHIRDSVTLLGLDLKITEDSRLVCLEINGANSGIQGYAMANSSDELISSRLEEALKPFDKQVFVVGNTITDTGCFRFIDARIKEYFEMEAYLSSRLFRSYPNPLEFMPADFPLNWIEPSALPRTWRNFFSRRKSHELISWDKAEGVIFDRSSMSHYSVVMRGVIERGFRRIFNEGAIMLANSPGVEYWLNDKSFLRLLLKDVVDIPLTFNVSSLGNMILNGAETYDRRQYVVFKPKTCAHGDYVEVINLHDLLNGKIPKWMENYQEKAISMVGNDFGVENCMRQSLEGVFQEFIRGKPIANPSTGKMHSGTMRYLVLMISNGGEISTNCIGGYWRLAPSSLSAHASLNERYVANLNPVNPARPLNPAIPVPLSDLDEAFVQEQLVSKLPQFYQRLLGIENCTVFDIIASQVPR